MGTIFHFRNIIMAQSVAAFPPYSVAAPFALRLHAAKQPPLALASPGTWKRTDYRQSIGQN